MLLQDQSECRIEFADTQHGITVKHSGSFIEYFLDRQYTFVRQADVLDGLGPKKDIFLITFENEYRNNIYDGNILKEYGGRRFSNSTSHTLE